MTSLLLTTPRGIITLALRADAAPRTVAHVVALVNSRALDGTTFYRSDFVIQCGLHGTGRKSPLPDLAVNESTRAGALPNARGAMAVAHWDVPDCGNSEFFISLQDNAHLNQAYGGYCVFAQVAAGDAASWATVDAIAKAVKAGEKTPLTKAEVR